jgi:hypothetical protein
VCRTHAGRQRTSRTWRTKESSDQMELFWASRDRLRARRRTEASSSSPRCKHVLLQSYLAITFFSDTAYPMSLQGFTGIEATENLHEIACDILMASLRIVIAWIFGCLSKKFPALRSADKLCPGNDKLGLPSLPLGSYTTR